MEIPDVFVFSYFVLQYLWDELLCPVKAKALQNSCVGERKSNLALL